MSDIMIHMLPHKSFMAQNGLHLVEALNKGVCLIDSPKHYKLLPRLLITLQNLTVRPYC